MNNKSDIITKGQIYRKLVDDKLTGVDQRMYNYVIEVLDNPERHNKWEILSVIRFLHFFYERKDILFNKTKVQKFTKFYEFLKFPSEKGPQSFKLTPVQYFQFSNILGFYKPDGSRLTRTALLYVPRKFSKTTSVAALAIYDLMFGDADAQAYVASNSFAQAKICYDIISSTLKQLDPREKSFKRNRDIIYSLMQGRTSLIRCLSSAADKLDGLNCSTVILDEYSNADTAALKNVLTSSMGIRKSPLTVMITTASTKLDTPFTIELENNKKILEGVVDDDSVFSSIFEPDDGDDYGSPDTWRKVQPHLNITVNESFYEAEWKRALRSASDMVEFKTKLLNIFTLPADKDWVDPLVIKKNLISLKLQNITTRPYCMVGVDLSVKDDFSSVAYGMYDSLNKKFLFYVDCYIPRNTLYTHANSEMYLRWVEQGFLKICGEDVIDYDMIAKDIVENSRYVNILAIGYDAYKSHDFINTLKALGVKCCTPYKQTYANFTSPVEIFEKSVYESKMQFADNPIICWCINNVAIDEDTMGNRKPIKKTHNKKIDPVICILESIGLFSTWKR